MSYLLEYDAVIASEITRTLGANHGLYDSAQCVLALPGTQPINSTRSTSIQYSGGYHTWSYSAHEEFFYSGSLTRGYVDVSSKVHLQSGSSQTHIAVISLRPLEGRIPKGNQAARWGIFSNQYGYYFGWDQNGLYTACLENNQVYKTYQKNWNLNALTGEEEDVPVFDFNSGSNFYIETPSNAYGNVVFGVTVYDETDHQQRFFPVHSHKTQGSCLIRDPLPVRVLISNSGTSSNGIGLYVADRQAYVFNPQSTPWRNFAQTTFNKKVGRLTSRLYPVLSLRKRTDYLSIPWQIMSIPTYVNNGVTLYLVGDAKLSSPKWLDPTFIDPKQSIVERDDNSSSMTGGSVIYACGQWRHSYAEDLSKILTPQVCNYYRQITLAATYYGNRYVSGTINWKENW